MRNRRIGCARASRSREEQPAAQLSAQAACGVAARGLCRTGGQPTRQARRYTRQAASGAGDAACPADTVTGIRWEPIQKQGSLPKPTGIKQAALHFLTLLKR
ncbi:hypothetical protein ET464_04155 [Paenibacillus protaetiae]|uniref:Uncharacterized protein n=1 Tax=Paenibacillus protaetiae TaxID=2509456 RepID=A0A4P6ESY9_9BACL|nr:hypothetical protein ET464_04155 [Paenibacillus protaetiae]